MYRRRRPAVHLLAVLALTAGLVAGGRWVAVHPASIPSLLLHSWGIRWLQPTFRDRRPGVELFPGFLSYQSSADVRSLLRERGLVWEESGEQLSESPDGRPPYVFFAIDLHNHEHLGHRGRLTLSFFNDRLASTIFYPADPAAYVAALERALRIAITDGEYAFPAPHTRVWFYTDVRGRQYVGWIDTRLAEEDGAWVMRYS